MSPRLRRPCTAGPTDRRVTALRTVLAVGAVLALTLAACSSTNDVATPATADDGTADQLSGTLTVSAAASLTDAFERLGNAFTRAHPGTEIHFNFGSSGALAEQIEQGAPADVVAFADPAPMERLAEADLVEEVKVLARNSLIIITRPTNPAGIGALEDLATAGTVSLCVLSAPCGALADQMLNAAGVTLDESSITRGQDVRAALGAVAEGDAVVGIVYLTDANAADDRVATVEIPAPENVVAEYRVAVVSGTPNPQLAAAFVEFVRSREGRAILSEFGFNS